jgi:hypothetical protein
LPNFRFSMNPPEKLNEQKTRLSPGFPSADYLPPVLFSSGLGKSFSGCGAGGVTGGVFVSGFGVSAAMLIVVMEMTFHVQPKEISRQKAAIARAAFPIEAALRWRRFNSPR